MAITICGLKLKYAIWIIIGSIFLFPPMTPVGAVILIGTYMAAMSDAKKMDREHAKNGQAEKKFDVRNVEYEIMEVNEEADVAYPDAEEEFNKKKFQQNSRRWR